MAAKAGIIYENIFAPFQNLKCLQECAKGWVGLGVAGVTGDVLYFSDLLLYLCPDRRRFVSQTDLKWPWQ